MNSLARFAILHFLGIAFAIPVLSAAHATDPALSSDSPSVVEPGRYRGPYVPLAGREGEPDPFAPGPGSRYWIRLEMTDPEGRKTFHPSLVEVAAQLRYEHRNREIGLDLQIDLGMHPQPFLTVNEKIYPVKVDFSGWRLVAHVTANVGTRMFEEAWFAAFAQQTARVSSLPPSTAASGTTAEFRVRDVAFGPLQKTVVHDDGRTTSQAGYSGRLTLRETFGSFVSRQWGLAVQQSFLVAYGALISLGVGSLAGLAALTRRWLRARRGRGVVVPPAGSAAKDKPRPRRIRNRRKKRR